MPATTFEHDVGVTLTWQLNANGLRMRYEGCASLPCRGNAEPVC